ncbi:MAG: hypothetical protein A2Y23_11085 [Clostridiales bacterium GWB2_37_7]|nr:MAG: hypothetical protein A2Y23_11085 [Clostridiales bacterium GWB2_37_7]
MKINISKISRCEGIKENFDIIDKNQYELLFNNQTFKTLPPLSVRGYAVNYEGKIEVDFETTATVELQCSRCIENYVADVHASSFHIFVKEGFQTDEDQQFYKGDEIDLTDIVLNEITAELPMKPLCTTDCKGLCPECGTNNNQRSCGCKAEEIDSRLQVLQKLLEDEQGGV